MDSEEIGCNSFANNNFHKRSVAETTCGDNRILRFAPMEHQLLSRLCPGETGGSEVQRIMGDSTACFRPNTASTTEVPVPERF
jgi:hypothetical protein